MPHIEIEKLLAAAITRAEAEGLRDTSTSLRYLKADLAEAMQQRECHEGARVLDFSGREQQGDQIVNTKLTI